MNPHNTLVATTLMYPPGKLPHGARLMLDSAAYHGIELTIIGEGEKYENWWASKCVRLWERLKDAKGFDHIVYVDGVDTLFAAGVGEMVTKYRQHHAGQFVVGGEHYCWPWHRPWADKWPKAWGRYRHPCGGFWMAEWPAFLETFGKLMNLPPCPLSLNGQTIDNNDQMRLHYAWCEGHARYAVDYRNHLSLSFNGLDGRWHTNNDILWGKRPQNRQTLAFPCTFHGNGSHKWRMGELWEMLRG